MNENELYHFGVKGMKWGVRRNRSSFVSTSGPKRLPGTYASDGNGWTAKAKRLPGTYASDGNGSFRTRRLQRAVNANNRDVKSLKSAGYNKEAAAVKAVGDKNRAKLAKSQARDAARNTPEAQARKEKLKKAAKVVAAVAGTALAAYGVYKVSKAISNKKQMQAAEAAVKKSLADKSTLMNTVNAAKKNPNFSNANRGAWTSGKHSYVYDKASGTEGSVSTAYLNFLRNQRK